MPEEAQKRTPDEKIATSAKAWRRHDRDATANKHDNQKQRAEYRARQKLREVIDTAES